MQIDSDTHRDCDEENIIIEGAAFPLFFVLASFFIYLFVVVVNLTDAGDGGEADPFFAVIKDDQYDRNPKLIWSFRQRVKGPARSHANSNNNYSLSVFSSSARHK